MDVGVVIANWKTVPVIIADGGPAYKMGKAPPPYSPPCPTTARQAHFRQGDLRPLPQVRPCAGDPRLKADVEAKAMAPSALKRGELKSP